MASEFISWIDEKKIIPLEAHLMNTANLAEKFLGRDWKIISKRFGINENLLRYASLLHDVGKVAYYRVIGTPNMEPSKLSGFRNRHSFSYHEVFSTLCVVCLKEVDALSLQEGEYFILELSVLFHHFGMENRYVSKRILTYGELKIKQLMNLGKTKRKRYVLDFVEGRMHSEEVSLTRIIDEMLGLLSKIGLTTVDTMCDIDRCLLLLKNLISVKMDPEESGYPALFALLGYLSVADSLSASMERDGKIPKSGYKRGLMNELGISEEDLRSLLQDPSQ